MYFQISPVRKFHGKRVKTTPENEEIPILLLAPFTRIPKLAFQNIPVNSSHETLVLIKNPGVDPVAVNVTFGGPDDLNLSLNWNEEIIDNGVEKLLIISWNPKFTISVRYSLKISSQKQSWSIPISFQSISTSPKKNQSNGASKISLKLAKKTPISIKKSSTKPNTLSNSLERKGNLNASNPSTSQNTKKIDDFPKAICISENSPEFDDSLELQSPSNVQKLSRKRLQIDEFNDSLESPESSKERRQILSQIDENSCSFGNFLTTEIGSISAITPSCRNFRPKRVSSEKKENSENEFNYLNTSYDVRFSENVANFRENSAKLRRFNNATSTSSSLSINSERSMTNINNNSAESGFEVLDQTLENTKLKFDETPKFSPVKRRIPTPETWSKMEPNQKLTKISKVTMMRNYMEISENTYIIRDPFILAATTSIDPFLTNTIYLDENWINEQELRFKRWFNRLLAPPVELEVTENGQNIDAAKIWAECLKRDVPAPPTKEAVSITYHTKSKLDILRKTARNFYKSHEMKEVLSKISKAIESGKLEIRPDRNVHLDLVLQKKIITLLLSYNPLWLRIGLETVYNECLNLNSNSDIVGLSRFIYDRFFKDPHLLKRYKSAYNPKYTANIKKFILKKYLYLVYFLDKAKIKTLIKHDPCLFRRNSEIKECKEMLVQFSKDAITGGVGDINRYLKYFGYVVNHKQFYIHEYDYAVTNLGTDLRDGIRLTRVMELILLRNDLTEKLRVPTVSRLQKIHNVKLVFKSLEEAEFEIQHEIEASHIVDGHREKTLSFLWQIIYKFQAPLVIKTAENIQKWWRSFPICAKRLKLRKIRNHKTECATKIQRWYRRHITSKKLLIFATHLKKHLDNKKLEKAVTKIQSYFKMYKQRKKYLNTRSIIIKLQKHCKLWLENRRRFKAAVIIQKNVRKFLVRSAFLKLKNSVLTIEKIYSAKLLMLEEKQRYENLKRSTILIQQWFRMSLSSRKIRNNYLKLKNATQFIQGRYRTKLETRKMMVEYQKIRKSSIIIQNWYRSIKRTQKQRAMFLKMKNSVRVIEKYYIAHREMKIARTRYLEIRNSVIIIQERLRATIKMKEQQEYYIKLKKSANFIKEKYKAKKCMVKDRENYLNLQRKVIFIQRKFRAKNLMKIQRQQFLNKKNSCIKIQKYFRSVILVRREREYFVKLQSAARLVQNKYRAKKTMEICKKQYEQLRETSIFIQQKFRANKLTKIQRSKYVELKNVVVFIQAKFRAKQMMLKAKNDYQNLRKNVIFIQRKYKANNMMKIQRNSFLETKKATIVLQSYIKSYLKMKKDKELYMKIKKSAMIIQLWYISYKRMIILKTEYQSLKTVVVMIQQKFRSNQLMKKTRQIFLLQKQSCIKIQRFFRGFLLMKLERHQFLQLKNTASFIQKKYRAKKTMQICRKNYENIKKSTVLIQRKFRANQQMKLQRLEYISQKIAATKIQEFFRGYRQMKIDRARFLSTISATATIQRVARGFLTRKKYGHLLTPEAREERRIRKLQEAAATKIQAYWRGHQCRSKNGEKMRLIRRRSQNARENANTENTLGSRCESALRMLISESITYSTIAAALVDLEYVTRRSRELCSAYGPILPEQMYVMIISSARSLPEVKVIELSALIILNFCKFQPTKVMTWFPNYMDGVVDTMMHWCDKEDLVFPALATLIWIFAHNEDYKKKILELPTFHYKMEKIRVLLVRKEKMVGKSKKLLISRFQSYRSLHLPDLNPDWGFDYIKRPRTFTNSIHALECLIEIFNLS